MLEIRVSGPLSAGKTTATEIIRNLLTDAGYDVRVTDGRGKDCPPHLSSLRRLPETYSKTAVRLIDCETPEPSSENRTAAFAFGIIGIGMVVVAVMVDGSVPFILTGITASVLGVMIYKAIFNT